MKRHASMNRIYRLVWSHVHKVWIPVAEIARGRSKGSSRKLFAAALSLTAAVGHTEPIGGQIVSGNGSISQSGSTTTINQSSQNLSANWQSFNIAPTETVNFVQPNTSAIAVNRIFDTNGSQILGHLNANGQVYLINPNGIVFGQGAQVNVGGLVASTLDINDASLNSNTRTFSGSGTGSVINKGTITAANGGSVALIGNSVGNQGTIIAQLGTVALGAGNAVTLTFNGNNLVHMQVDQSVLNSLAENGGLIRADGGQVIMTAGARDTLLTSVVNNTGVIEARTVQQHEGVITLLGGMTAGTVNVGGTLDASAPSTSVPSPSGGGLGWGNNGGFIETSAAHVHIADSARVTTVAPSGNSGTWLIDPVDFTIAASGGDMTGAAVNAALAGGNFTIMSTSGAGGTAGNININDAVTWAANLFTLNAQNNININANLNGSGTARLALEYGQGAVAAGNTSNISTGTAGVVNLPAGTTNFTTLQGSDGVVKAYTVITALGAQGSVTTTDLQGMSGGLALNYALGADIVATPTSLGAWYAAGGFAPVGAPAVKFTGIFDGLGHTISNLTINRSATTYVGLFGAVNGAVRNVGLLGGNVTGSTYTGGLAGRNYSTISNSYSTGNVTGASYTGGLVGNNDGAISNSYATGNVTGTGWGAGGLVGGSIYGTVSNSHATGTVIGNNNVGGLVGSNRNGNIVSNSYATGQVTGAKYAGGLVGADMGSGAIETSYSTGKVTATTSNGGGLLGKGNAANVTNSFWDITTSTQAVSAGGTGLATAQMKQQSSFAGQWDFTTPIWRINPAVNNGYPCLAAFSNCIAAASTTIYLYLTSGISTYGNTPTFTYGYYTTPTGGVAVTDASPTGSVVWSNPLSATSNAGSYSETYVSGITLGNPGYILSAGNAANWTINKAQLTVAANNQTRLYGAANPIFNETISGFVNGEDASVVSGTATGTSTATTGTGVGTATITGSIGSLTAGNYTFVAANGILTINPATLTVTANNQTRLYATANPIFDETISGFVNGEDASVVSGTATGTSTATTGTGVGTATITGSTGSLVASNYNFVAANGTLTINPAPLTITANISLPLDVASAIAQINAGKKADLMVSNYRYPEVINEGIRLPVQPLAAAVNSPGFPELLPPPLAVLARPIADPVAKSAAIEPVVLQKSHAATHIPVKTASVICNATDANTLASCGKKSKSQEPVKQAIKPAIKLGMSRELKPVAGDQLAQSFHESPWLDNSGINNAGRSRSDSQYARQLSGISIMSNPIFFFIP